MIKLIKTELRKHLNYKPFLISIALFTVLLSTIFVSINKLNLDINGGDFIFKSVYAFPDIWHNLGYISGWFNALLGIIVIIIITNEFQFRTIRQNVIDGVSRLEFLAAKILFILLMSVYALLFVFILGMICGNMFSDTATTETVLKKIGFLFTYGLQTFAIMIFALFIGLLVKKQGMSIILFLLYTFIIENISAFLLGKDVRPDSPILNKISEYLPLKVYSGMIKNPFLDIVGISAPEFPETKYIIATVIYIAVFSGLSYLIMHKSNL